MTEELVRLNHAELQLLDLVEEYGIWIAGIQNGDSWGSNNKWCHEYSAEQSAEALEHLLHIGLIELYRGTAKDNCPPSAPPRTREELLKELLRTDITFDSFDTRTPDRAVWLYHLTADGARVWQQFVQPNWDQYIEHGYQLDEDDPEGDKIGEVRAASPELAKLFIELAHHLGQKIVPGTLEWSEDRPWQIRTWKQLPVCYRVKYGVKQDDDDDLWSLWNKMPWELWQLLYGWRRQRICP